MTEKDATHSLVVTNGMAPPVNGVLTSTFGFRKHPILGVVRLHKGVDWKAPVGTPIMAAFDGTIAYIGDGKGYGNVIRIDHGGGRATAYAHMSRFEPAMHKGSRCMRAMSSAMSARQGCRPARICISSSTRTASPSIRWAAPWPRCRRGRPRKDRWKTEHPGKRPAAGTPRASDSAAVEKLVNRIIHVESGGSARAKNPKSSASGLGQFIKSTWLRMMKTYQSGALPIDVDGRAPRAALRRRRSRARWSANLARENEARLRHFGHSITAGRLYLAHFLGPDGAHQALAASGDASIAALMGASVIAANPFLTGKDCAFVIAGPRRR